MHPDLALPLPVLTVLIVDDDRTTRLVVSALVRAAGHLPLEADSGEVALGLFAGAHVDVVLMDVVMPGMGGYSAAARIKALAGERWLPLVFLSGLGERESRAQWIDVGDDYLSKPVDAQILTARLSSFRMAIAQDRHSRRVADEMLREQRLARHLMEQLGLRRSADAFPCIEIHSEAASVSSGDAMVIEEEGERLHLFVADAMGHGLAAAVSLLPAISIFRAMAQKGFGPDLIAAEINLKLREMLPRERFISGALIQVDRHRNMLWICNCGLPAPVLVGPDGRVSARFPSQLPPLGVLEGERFERDAYSHPWVAGEQLVLWTDGFTEAFGTDQLDGLLAEHLRPDAAPGAVHRLWDARLACPTGDDASLVVMRLKAATTMPAPEAALEAGMDARGEVLGRVVLLPRQLRASPGAGQVLAMFAALGLDALEGDPRAAVVLSELLSNAIEHGVLGLESSLKARGAEGFDAYYRLRAERLARLEAGWVEIEIRAASEPDFIEIDVKDCGAGFDPGRTPRDPGQDGAGRGLLLLRGLCERVEQREGGRRTVVVLRLTS